MNWCCYDNTKRSIGDPIAAEAIPVAMGGWGCHWLYRLAHFVLMQVLNKISCSRQCWPSGYRRCMKTVCSYILEGCCVVCVDIPAATVEDAQNLQQIGA